jgi:hypothetical protein
VVFRRNNSFIISRLTFVQFSANPSGAADNMARAHPELPVSTAAKMEPKRPLRRRRKERLPGSSYRGGKDRMAHYFVVEGGK